MCFDAHLFGLTQFFQVCGSYLNLVHVKDELAWVKSEFCLCLCTLLKYGSSLWWNRHPVTRRPIRALNGWAAFILLGSTTRRSRCCWSKIILCDAPRICVRKAVFPPYAGSMVHLKTSHGQNRPRRAVLCNFRTQKKRRPVGTFVLWQWLISKAGWNKGWTPATLNVFTHVLYISFHFTKTIFPRFTFFII